MNKEIAHYVVTAHPPGGVLLTAKCNFLSEHSTVCVCLFVCLFVGVTVNELASAFAGLFALLSLKDKTVSVVGEWVSAIVRGVVQFSFFPKPVCLLSLTFLSRGWFGKLWISFHSLIILLFLLTELLAEGCVSRQITTHWSATIASRIGKKHIGLAVALSDCFANSHSWSFDQSGTLSIAQMEKITRLCHDGSFSICNFVAQSTGGESSLFHPATTIVPFRISVILRLVIVFSLSNWNPRQW